LCLCEYLEQQAWFAAFGRAIEQNAARFQRIGILAMAGKALIQHRVICLWRRGHKGDAIGFEPIPAGDQIIANERDMLNAFAVKFAQELLNLAFAAFALFIERDANLAIGCG